jgi:hypothetical protein
LEVYKDKALIVNTKRPELIINKIPKTKSRRRSKKNRTGRTGQRKKPSNDNQRGKLGSQTC